MITLWSPDSLVTFMLRFSTMAQLYILFRIEEHRVCVA
jgi:hypothetical protein